MLPVLCLKFNYVTQDTPFQEKEREAKRLAKVEKEKKQQEAKDKSRNMFASFFNKSKRSASSGDNAKLKAVLQSSEPGPSSPSKKLSDFERTFKPFSLKKGAELAPVNWFHDLGRRGVKAKSARHRVEGDVIVIEDDEDDHIDSRVDESGDVEMADLTSQESPHLGQMTAEGA